jgi:ubiquinone/menaquinone biosynthesis C-methylase UbiE
LTRAAVGSAYDARAAEYIGLFGSVDLLSPQDRDTIARWGAATDGCLLDAGCGPGHWSDALSDGGRRTVVSVDASAAFLASARRRFPRVPFAQADLSALPVASSSVGGVLAWYSLIHTPPAGVPAILGELARVLRPGGSLLLGFFDGDAATPFAHTVTTGYFWSADALGEMLVREGFVVERSATRQDPGARRRHGELVATLS